MGRRAKTSDQARKIRGERALRAGALVRAIGETTAEELRQRMRNHLATLSIPWLSAFCGEHGINEEDAQRLLYRWFERL